MQLPIRAWQRIFRALGFKQRKSKRRSLQVRQHHAEVLEDRCLLAGTITIDNQDAGGAEVAGGGIDAVFRVTGTGFTETTTVRYETQGHTATQGSDYVGVSGTLTFYAGDSYYQIIVPVLDDTIAEPSETFELRVFDRLPTEDLFREKSMLWTILTGQEISQHVLSLTIGDRQCPTFRFSSTRYPTNSCSSSSSASTTTTFML